MIWDGDGSVVARRQFEPYGQVVADWWSEVTDTRYAGHRLHVSSGLHDFGARWYDSATGSFMSVDPLIADLIDPQQHNPYAYARGNPVVLSDPTGLFTNDSAALGSECGGSCGGGSTSIFIAGGYTGPVGVSGSTNIADMFSGRGPGLGSAATPESSGIPFQVLGTEARIGALGSIDFSDQVSPAAPQQSQSNGVTPSDVLDATGKAVGVLEILVSGKELLDSTPGEIAKGSRAVAGAGIVVGGLTAAEGVAERNLGKTLVGAGETAAGVRALSLARGGTALTPAGFAANVALQGGMILFEDQLVNVINRVLEGGSGGPTGCGFGTCSDPLDP